MHYRKKIRLEPDVYQGYAAYSLTICTANRSTFFTDAETVAACIELLRRSSRAMLDVYAYCFMPDHLHILAAGNQPDALMINFVKHFKQATGFWFQRRSGRHLWQKGFFDHIVRRNEDIRAVARYILNNPVRAGLVNDFRDYPYLGSFVYNSLDDLM